jgi:hypothetical protein
MQQVGIRFAGMASWRVGENDGRLKSSDESRSVRRCKKHLKEERPDFLFEAEKMDC